MKLKKIKIGNIETDNNLFLAPLAGYTDFAFRELCLSYGASLAFTEMISCKGLYYDNINTKKLLITGKREKIKAVQIFGCDADIMKKAVESESFKKFDIVDINMGCPVPKLFKNGEGSALLNNLSLSSKIIEACAKTGKNITVKCRIGVDKDHIVTEDFAKMCEDSGAKMLTIHGRTRDCFYLGEVNYKEIEKAKNRVKIPVIANGGVIDKFSADMLLERTGADGIMVARGALYRPYVFAEILGKKIDINLKDMIFNQIDNMLEVYDDRYVNLNLRKLVGFYLKGVEGSKKYKPSLLCCENTTELKDLLEKFLI